MAQSNRDGLFHLRKQSVAINRLLGADFVSKNRVLATAAVLHGAIAKSCSNIGESFTLSQYALLEDPASSTLLEYQHLYQTEASMNSIQLEVIPHQTQEGMPYQRLHFQIMTDDGIITPDHPNADKLIGLQIPCSSNG